MNVMRHRGLQAAVQFDAEEGLFVGRLVGINDVVGFHAETVADLQAAFREAVDDYVATCGRVGKAPEMPVVGELRLRVPPEVYASAALAAKAAGKTLEQWGEDAIGTAAKRAALIPT